MSCLSVSFGCHVSFYILISSESSKSSGGGILVSRIFSQLGDGGDGICGLCFFLGRERGTPIPNNLSSSDPTSNSGCGLRFLFFRGFLLKLDANTENRAPQAREIFSYLQ